ncbi:ribosomal-processing cysteine protease Prp [Bacillaceae bacterium SIJ1]|uniref:ribosomal-processing cysteine protease Prp n=1 Tax=Litoribacterium kuwaitense TaxID=1398745 RepID=UPI0013EC948C|nr:ribosomal-processing cysteine protease Prp [Litoribacterium kuwaitense]NGP45480.1 ribosomal-processing cysteine protease Prp [Litoribacterium kuwaitense]
MVRIHVSRDLKTKRFKSVEITGHAESGPYGQDLVCAAVSAVSIGGLNAAMELSGQTLDIEQNEHEGGYLACKIPASVSDAEEEKVQLLLEAMLSSLRTIVRQYGEFVSYSEN